MAEPADQSRRKRKSSQRKLAAAVGGGLLVLILLGLGFRQSSQPVLYQPDPNAETMAADGTMSAGELKAQLQSQAEASSFRLQLNAKPQVRGDQADLLLGNPAENKLCLSVSVTLDKDGEVLYTSGLLPPGAQELTVQLNKTLPPGEYPATAVCTAIDPETGAAVGTPVEAGLLLQAVAPEESGQSP